MEQQQFNSTIPKQNGEVATFGAAITGSHGV